MLRKFLGDKQPRFRDGDLDLWPQAREFMPNKAAINTIPKQECEQRRDHLIQRLSHYVMQLGTSFTITHPSNVRIVEGVIQDIWAHALYPDGRTAIQIPRHVVVKRPRAGKAIRFRPEVPGFLILGNMAHEVAHRDRSLRDPESQRALYEGSRADNRHEIDPTKFRQEEIASDIEAYDILRRLEVPLLPQDYVDTIPQPDEYRDELASKLPVV